ncbi:MAG: hypothetical protein KGL46_12875 [Hyphomicrobiales bacterium]|nr:hypothetical protein [Hyphomicrobiales bacterium]
MFGLVVWGLVLRRYFWPWLVRNDLQTSSEPVLYMHAFRYIGLSFIAPGVTGAGLNGDWAVSAAWGDVASAVLALLALALRNTLLFRPALWLFSVVGVSDLLHAFATGSRYEVPPHLSGAFFIPILVVPALLWTHLYLVILLLRRRSTAR